MKGAEFTSVAKPNPLYGIGEGVRGRGQGLMTPGPLPLITFFNNLIEKALSPAVMVQDIFLKIPDVFFGILGYV
jgi:hypothetical protein